MVMMVDVINITTLPKYIVKTSFATMAFEHLKYVMDFTLIFYCQWNAIMQATYSCKSSHLLSETISIQIQQFNVAQNYK